jgi:hypothetical protein
MMSAAAQAGSIIIVLTNAGVPAAYLRLLLAI